jgi:dTDP-4-dehydrorhamnose 3,5-epimerase
MRKVAIEKFGDVIILNGERFLDSRGEFVRIQVDPKWPKPQYYARSINKLAGTFRGIHYQTKPFSEHKYVTVSSGAIIDYVVCVDQKSKNFGSWAEIEISEDNLRVIHIPPGYAHGYQTLADATEVSYGISGSYSKAHARTLNYAQFNFDLRLPISSISEKDYKGEPIAGPK